MADIEVIIKIPEEEYNICLSHAQSLENSIRIHKCFSLEYAVIKGILLPKGHGKLIDAKEYENSIRKHYFDNRTVIRCTEIALYSAETIVEADKN